MPEPFQAEVSVEMPHRYKDGGLLLKFVSLKEWDAAHIARLVEWVGSPAVLTVSASASSPPPPESAPLEDHGQSSVVPGLPAEGRRGHSASQDLRFQLRGVFIQIDPEADLEAHEQFYQWAMKQIAEWVRLHKAGLTEQWRRDNV